MTAIELKQMIFKTAMKHPEVILKNTNGLNVDVQIFDKETDSQIGFGCEFNEFGLYHYTTFDDRNGYVIKSNISHSGMIMIDSIINNQI